MSASLRPVSIARDVVPPLGPCAMLRLLFLRLLLHVHTTANRDACQFLVQTRSVVDTADHVRGLRSQAACYPDATLRGIREGKPDERGTRQQRPDQDRRRGR